MLRTAIALLLGAVVTFALLAFMANLVTFDGRRFNKSEKTPQFLINPQRQESETQQKTRFKPRLPPPDSPPRPTSVLPDTIKNIGGISFDLPEVEIDNRTSLVSRPMANMMREGDATPIFRIEPRYPMAAARDGKEGYVVLSFSINKLGGVEDIKVLESEPGRLFDKEARRALKRWKYKPKVSDGVALKQTGQTVRLDFSLEKKKRR